jgi:hypothetical protein
MGSRVQKYLVIAFMVCFLAFMGNKQKNEIRTPFMDVSKGKEKEENLSHTD